MEKEAVTVHDYKVKDIQLAEWGRKEIEIAEVKAGLVADLRPSPNTGYDAWVVSFRLPTAV